MPDILDDNLSSKTKKRHRKHSSRDSSNKLRFKTSHKKCKTDDAGAKKFNSRPNVTKISSDDEYAEHPLNPRVVQLPSQKSTKKSKGSSNARKCDSLSEYGPKINGYRFVSLDPNEDKVFFKGTNYTKHTSRPDINAGYKESLPKPNRSNQYDPYKSDKYKESQHVTQFSSTTSEVK
ncbi:unnamed protein product [Ambrosiozyma monospora]|uniref:Unnamed protein product n=1 Tax=Ambrosiozyma monospora TaxID=43982 RepID=A0A9W6T3V5_AMBMO|nr:unnamed protein product [Ambrosiozyma monospora]